MFIRGRFGLRSVAEGAEDEGWLLVQVLIRVVPVTLHAHSVDDWVCLFLFAELLEILAFFMPCFCA